MNLIPLNTLPIATATLPLTKSFPFAGGQPENADALGLPLGTHDIFVYVDPTFDEADQPGKVLENEEDDNIAYRRISIDMGVIGTVSSSQIVSLDRNCVVTAPPGVLQNPAVLTVNSLDEQKFAAVGASSVDATVRSVTANELASVVGGMSNRAPLPGTAYGYELAISSQQSAVGKGVFVAGENVVGR